jgi:DNA-directed RNA polymerase subunit RPC12/RpoP
MDSKYKSSTASAFAKEPIIINEPRKIRFLNDNHENLQTNNSNFLSIDFRDKEILWIDQIGVETCILGIDLNILSLPVQRQLGDCWFVSACYALFSQQQQQQQQQQESKYNLSKILLKSLFLNLNEIEFAKTQTLKVKFFHPDNTLVSIDKYLPISKQTNDFIYGCCTQKNHLWFSLVEKAYAKLYNGYENIVSGIAEEAFIDLSGAFTLYLNPNNLNDLKVIKEKLKLLKNKNRLIACADTKANLNINNNKSHSFVIIDIKESKKYNDTIITLKNTWSSHEEFFSYLTKLSINKMNTNELIELKMNDFSSNFGSISLAMYVPLPNEKPFWHDFTDTFKILIKEGTDDEYLTPKDNLLNILLSAEIYLLETSRKNEVLLNLTQYIHFTNSEKQKLKLYIFKLKQVNRVLKTSYLNRIELLRDGRTLSKLIELESNTSYLICFYALSNDTLSNTKYLFRCLPSELITIRKVNRQDLKNKNIQIIIETCGKCNSIIHGNNKYFKNNNNEEIVCNDCHEKSVFKPKTCIESIINDYANL